jgi:two-component system OmpR family sensor kinase
VSLRSRLLVGLVALAAVGLLVADVATYRALQSFLVDRVDSTLQQDHVAVEQVLSQTGSCDALGHVSPTLFVRVANATQTRVLCTQVPHAFGGQEAPKPPRVPSSIALTKSVETGGRPEHLRYLTVPAVEGGGQYRLRASLEGNVVIVVGESLHDVNSTLHHLVVIMLLVTLLVLAAILGVGLWVVGVGLRPFRSIERTAGAIASGDLSQRVERAEPRTEIGRLGLALNAMLGQIETAFNERAESEARLRRFVADASHELRTPLAAVRAYAELFSRGAATRPDDLRRSMEGIEREAARMGVLVDDLLLLARLDEGRPLRSEPVQLDEVAVEAAETARALDPERPLTLDLEPAAVVGDHDRLRQIVDNLLANVRAHTPPTTPTSVSVRALDGTAVLEVRDRGPGLPSEVTDRVFERFYRADPSRARASGGAGLGLSIVAAVAEAHGGRVEVESTPGEGSTFRIELPLAQPRGSSAPSSSSR